MIRELKEHIPINVLLSLRVATTRCFYFYQIIQFDNWFCRTFLRPRGSWLILRPWQMRKAETRVTFISSASSHFPNDLTFHDDVCFKVFKIVQQQCMNLALNVKCWNYTCSLDKMTLTLRAVNLQVGLHLCECRCDDIVIAFYCEEVKLGGYISHRLSEV